MAVRVGGGDASTDSAAPAAAAAAASAADVAAAAAVGTVTAAVADAGDGAAPPPRLATGEGALFGTPAFVALSVRKSAAAAAVLAAGYDVVLTDVDVGWVGDAAAALGAAAAAAGDAAVAITSDARAGEPPNWVVNSGLYYAVSGSPLPPRGRDGDGNRDGSSRDGGVDIDVDGGGGAGQAVAPPGRAAEGGVERLLRAVALYARRQRRSEQKAWNAVACGAFKSIIGGPGRRVGTSACAYRGLRVAVVGTAAFPNGADDDLWAAAAATGEGDGSSARGAYPRWAPVVAAHANYVVGRRAKVRRLTAAGLWHLGGGADWRTAAAACLRRLP